MPAALSASTPLVSVLLPIYNGAAFLEAAIDSITRQSFEDWELILLDDGSSDGSAEIARSATAQDRRLRLVVRRHNQGLGAAMADLAALARGRYLAIQEQDDISAPDRLARQVALLDARPEIGLVSGVAEWRDGDGRRLALFPGLLTRAEQYPQEPRAMVAFLLREQCKVVNAGAMFRRDLLLERADRVPIFFDRRAQMSVDWQFFIRVAHHYRIWGLPEIVVSMRRDQHSLSARKELQFFEARRCLAKLEHDLLGDPRSSIDRRNLRQAWASQLRLEGRTWGRWRGLGLLLRALTSAPMRSDVWSSIFELVSRGLGRVR